MNNSNNPYENNSYLKNEEEVLKEVLFFEKFGLKQTKNNEKQPKEDKEDIERDC